MEVMFCGLLKCFPSIMNIELVFGVFTIGPGLFVPSQTTSYISFYVPTVHCISWMI